MKYFRWYHIPMIIITLINIIFCLSLPSKAATGYTLDSTLIDGVNKARMTKTEHLQVKSYVRRWNYRNKLLSNIEKLHMAIKDITSLADYQRDKYNPIDVLRGKVNCQGYSLMFRELMSISHIPNEILIDQPLNQKPTHMWNRITLDGVPMDVDLTVWEALLELARE